MNSFKERLRNIINDSLLSKEEINLEKNFNRNIIETQRKIVQNNNIIFTNSHKSSNISKEKNIEINSTPMVNKTKNKNARAQLHVKKLNLNDISQEKDNYDIKKKYKSLYNQSCMNLINKKYNKNKTYLNYKNLNNINKNIFINLNFDKENSNVNSKKKINRFKEKCSALSAKNIFHNSNKIIFNTNNLNFERTKKENSYYISNPRIALSIKKKIKSLILENDLENLSHKNNISNKIPNVLNSDLYKFDNKYYNDISPLTKYINFNNEKSKKKSFKYFTSNNSYISNFNNDYNTSKYVSYYKLSNNRKDYNNYYNSNYFNKI